MLDPSTSTEELALELLHTASTTCLAIADLLIEKGVFTEDEFAFGKLRIRADLDRKVAAEMAER